VRVRVRVRVLVKGGSIASGGKRQRFLGAMLLALACDSSDKGFYVTVVTKVSE